MFSTYYDYGRATSPPGSYPAPSSGDPIALDKVTTPASNSTTTSYSWTHTPVGTPTFAVVVIAQNASSTDNITGVTYGGTSMTRVPTDGFASDTAGEPGAVYAYTLASPASGAKTVEVTKSTGTVYTVAASYTLTGTTPSLIDTNSRNEEDTTLYAALSNPSGLSAMGIAVGFTGHGDYATEMTEEGTTTVDMNDDPGAQVMFSGHSDVSTATSITVGWSQSYNDAASIQLLVAASAGSGPSPSSFAFDKVTTPAANTTTTVYSWTHTPVGTPDYVVVAVGVNGNSGADSISGVTYGGVSMTRVPTHGFAQDTSEEVGSVYLYTLASPSSGAQTVAVTKTGATIYALGA